MITELTLGSTMTTVFSKISVIVHNGSWKDSIPAFQVFSIQGLQTDRDKNVV